MGSENSKAAARDQDMFPFYELPRELRNQVYHYLWNDTLIAFRHNGLVTIARYQNNSEYTILDALPPWLGTSRQIRLEGMQQFYYHAHFSVGEYSTLPLYLYRTAEYSPYIAPYASRPHASVKHTAAPIKDVSSDLLCLDKARKLKVQKLCIKFEVSYGSRRQCLDRLDAFCSSFCCELSLDVSIAPIDHPGEPYPFQNFEALENLLQNKNTALRELELEVVPASPRLKFNHHQRFDKFLWRRGKDLRADTTYDWTFFTKLPKNLRRVNIAIIEDTITPRVWPRCCVLALQEARKKFEEVAPTLVALQETSEKQEIDLKCWSYMRFGLPIDWKPEGEPDHEEFFELSRRDHWCVRWEAISPLHRRQFLYMEDIASIVERADISPSIISQPQAVRKTVSIHRQE
jgi:hypothetical protein